jgi:signal peptidase I
MDKLKAPRKQWIKFSIAGFILILFTIWLGNFWVLFLLPFLLDIYVTKFIPWTWWKNIKDPRIRKIFEWADAILFALIAVYFINLYLFQNYKIPSSSLEKTLLVGDHLFVSKVAYGPRTPNTPFAFPLVQHTFPMLNCKSYLDIQWKSHRLAGFGEVQRNDIVVFNFPAGDTVCTSRQEVDYEGLCYEAGLSKLKNNQVNIDSLRSKGVDVRSLCFKIGRQIVQNDRATYGRIVYRPVDRRENYVKRCVAVAGDVLEVRNRELYINGKKQERQPGVQHYCEIISTQPLTQEIYDNLEISNENSGHALLGNNQSGSFVYVLPLTLQNQADLRKVPFVKSVTEKNVSELISSEQTTFPAGYNTKWTVDNYGPLWIPKAGKTIALTVKTLPLYERAIRNYEKNKLEVKNGKIYINGKETNRYTFKMDYFWMMGDNRHNSADSRIWGYVPEDHIVGKPLFVWLSLNPDKSLFGGGIRWNRFFKYAGK